MQGNFTLNEFEKRKSGLLGVLADAAGEGMVALEATDRLAGYLASRGVDLKGPLQQQGDRGLDTPLASEPSPLVEESEAPRSIRGFHDILISIGIVAGLSGLWGLGSVYLVLPAVILLSEIFVRRQRLALPAFILTGFLGTASVYAAIDLLTYRLAGLSLESKIDYGPLFVIGVTAIALAGFYWRYRIPVALAALLASAFGLIVWTAFALVSAWLDSNDLIFLNPLSVSLCLGSFAGLMFATALRLDLRDPERRTRRSDVAFWLHLVAAPALLYTLISLIFWTSPNQWFGEGTTVGQAIGVISGVFILMIAGIVLDRRAFVTSGLISLGYAFYVLFSRGQLETLLQSTENLLFAVLLMLGIVVLSLGIGWQWLRRMIVGELPAGLQARLSPLPG